jgi:hypothetical protein
VKALCNHVAIKRQSPQAVLYCRRFVATALQQAETSETTSNQSNHYDNPQMSIELVTTALQVNATTGSGCNHHRKGAKAASGW